jgi:hypothetical protein
MRVEDEDEGNVGNRVRDPPEHLQWADLQRVIAEHQGEELASTYFMFCPCHWNSTDIPILSYFYACSQVYVHIEANGTQESVSSSKHSNLAIYLMERTIRMNQVLQTELQTASGTH